MDANDFDSWKVEIDNQSTWILFCVENQNDQKITYILGHAIENNPLLLRNSTSLAS